MIYGVEAYDIAPPPAPPPTGLYSMLDFVNGVYDWDGATLTASDVTDKTAWISGTDGLVVPAAASAAAQLLYPAMQTFLAACDFSIVFTLDLLSTARPPATYIMTIDNAGEGFYIQIDYDGEWEIISYDGNFPASATDDVNSLAIGIHKIAVTQTNTRTSISVDGNAVITDTTGVVLPVDGFPMVNFYLGGWIDNTGKAIKIHKVEIYTPIDDADLPSYSA